MIRTFFFAAMLAPSLLAAPAAIADDASDRLGAARTLLETMHTKEMLPKLIDGLGKQVFTMFSQFNPGRNADVEKIVTDEMRVEIDRLGPEMIDALAHVHAENYTVEELRQLDAFYHTPVGQKSLELQPKFAAQSLAVGMQIGQRAAQAALPRIQQKLRERGLKTQKDT